MIKENELPPIIEKNPSNLRRSNLDQSHSQLIKDNSLYTYEPTMNSKLMKKQSSLQAKGIMNIQEKGLKTKNQPKISSTIDNMLAKASSVNLREDRKNKALTKQYTSIEPNRNRGLELKSKLEKKNTLNIQNNRVVGNKKLQPLPFEALKPQVYTFIISKGNNSKLVRKILTTRKHFVDYSELSNLERARLEKERQYVNFYWDPVKKTDRIEKLDKILSAKPKYIVTYNHFENNVEIASKYYLYLNLRAKYGEETDTFLPPTFIFDIYSKKFLENIAYYIAVLFVTQYPNYLTAKENLHKANIMDKNVDKKDHFGFKNEIKNYKSAINDLETFLNENLFNHISRKNSEIDLKKLFLSKLSNSQFKNYQLPFNNGKNMWLLKPDFCNRGTGVEVFKSLTDFISKLKTYIKGFDKDKNHRRSDTVDEGPVKTIRPKKFVVQKYIEQPMLFNDRKFDIRIYALIDHEGTIYISKEGYIRTSSEKFNLDAETHFVHLTNNAVQKHNQNYCKFEDGNILPLRQIEVSLKVSLWK